MYIFLRNESKYDRLENRYNVVFRMTRPKIDSLVALYWCIASLILGKKFVEYQLIYDGRVVSTARVTPKLPTFPFMPIDGYHIGPCFTEPEYRGRGFYPLLLQYIMELNPNSRYYMIVNEANESSLRGVKKVGFVEFARGKKDKFQRWIIC
jgi:GNAT superfamily N-acetyltransferase